MGWRLNRQIIGFLALTVLEMGYMVYQHSWTKDHAYYDGKYRLPVFIACRTLPLLLLLLWRFVIINSTWLVEKPFQVQTCILLTACVASVIHFFSYEALTENHQTASISH